MTGVEVQEISLDDQFRAALAHDKVKKHFAAGIEYFDDEFGPGTVLTKPELLAAFVQAAAMQTLAIALTHAQLLQEQPFNRQHIGGCQTAPTQIEIGLSIIHGCEGRWSSNTA